MAEGNSRSLHFAPPNFLWNLVALSHFMRPSLRKDARVALSSAVWQEIRVRSGRDDTSVWGWGFERKIWEVRGAHCRSLHCAPPDFLWNFVALVHFMRLSLTERRTRGFV